MKLFLIVFMCIYVSKCTYPILIRGTDLGKTDLFLDQQGLIDRLRTQDLKKIKVFNIQTYHEESDIFINRLREKTDQLKIFKALYRDSFVSPFIQYNSHEIIQELQRTNDLEVEVTQLNFLNLKKVEQELQSHDRTKELKYEIIVILFSRINSNVKLLQELSDQLTEDISAAQTNSETEADETDSDQIYNMTSNQLSAYLIVLSLLFTMWMGVSCMMDIKTPERFSKTNFYYGKET